MRVCVAFPLGAGVAFLLELRELAKPADMPRLCCNTRGGPAGEISLSGRVLPIGGVKEKTLAAKRSHVQTIIFPAANRRDWDELGEDVREGLTPVFAEHYADILPLLFPAAVEKFGAEVASVAEASSGLR